MITKKPLNIIIDSDSSKTSGGTIENPDTLIDAGKCLIEKRSYGNSNCGKISR